MAKETETIDKFMDSRIPQVDENLTVEQAFDIMKEDALRFLVITQNQNPLYLIDYWNMRKAIIKQRGTAIKDLPDDIKEEVLKVPYNMPACSVEPQLGKRPAVIVVNEKELMIGIVTATRYWNMRKSFL